MTINHTFTSSERDPRYCGYMTSTFKHTAFGTISMKTECGFPRSVHPKEGKVKEQDDGTTTR